MGRRRRSTSADSIELLRVWHVDERQHLMIKADAWDDPAAWGLLLVDIARHAAKAYAAQGFDPGEVLARIRLGFDAEWASPTDEP